MDTGQGPGSPSRGQMCEGHRCNIQNLLCITFVPFAEIVSRTNFHARNRIE